MKKQFLVLALAIAAASCGNGNVSPTNGTPENQTTDTTNMNNASQAPMGDTAHQINSNASSYPADSSNKSGDDSVKGTNPSSRKTTPGNASGKGGRKDKQ